MHLRSSGILAHLYKIQHYVIYGLSTMDIQSFSKNSDFHDLHKEENVELRFFCEAFSLIDSMMNTSMLLAFSNLVKENKDGRIQWGKIPEFFPEGAKSTRYLPALKRIVELSELVVHKGWVTPMRIRGLGQLALEVHKIHKNDAKKLRGKKSKNSSDPHISAVAAAAKTWKDVSLKFNSLAEHQEYNMAIHEDFQKENYIPNPNSWKVYLATFLIIFTALFYSIF